MAGSPSPTTSPTTSSNRGFYIALAAVAGIGVIAILYLLLKPSTVAIPINVAVQPSDTVGFQGYVLGSPTAPVEITEFADYQCPFCQTFATMQMPTIQDRLIKTGRLRFRYRDFPLSIHSHSRLAAHAAACASDQGADKYWAMHDRIYEGQGDWSSAGDAGGYFETYAKAVGLDLSAYGNCMKTTKYAGRIQASYDLGVRYGVPSTPTIMVGSTLWTGRLDSDAIIHLVDSLSPPAALPAALPAADSAKARP